jgi:hypothetical protein
LPDVPRNAFQTVCIALVSCLRLQNDGQHCGIKTAQKNNLKKIENFPLIAPLEKNMFYRGAKLDLTKIVFCQRTSRHIASPPSSPQIVALRQPMEGLPIGVPRMLIDLLSSPHFSKHTAESKMGFDKRQWPEPLEESTPIPAVRGMTAGVAGASRRHTEGSRIKRAMLPQSLSRLRRGRSKEPHMARPAKVPLPKDCG